MPTYIGFLRAINLGAARQFPKDAIRAAVEGAGCGDVETFINTGNVRFSTPMRSRARIERLLDAAFLADRGFVVPTVVLTAAELVAVAAHAASMAHSGRQYVELLRDEPPPPLVAEIEAASGPVAARVGRRAIHLLVDPEYAGATLIPGGIKKRLGVTTNRDVKVIAELAARWGR